MTITTIQAADLREGDTLVRQMYTRRGQLRHVQSHVALVQPRSSSRLAVMFRQGGHRAVTFEASEIVAIAEREPCAYPNDRAGEHDHTACLEAL